MEVVDDDVFFADLSKQISLLVMDDDDQIPPVSYYPSVALQGISRIVVHPTTTESPYHYEQNFRRSEVRKGTGVFIPRSSQWRRKNRQRCNHSQHTHYNMSSYRQFLPDRNNSNSGVSTTDNNPKKY